MLPYSCACVACVLACVRECMRICVSVCLCVCIIPQNCIVPHPWVIGQTNTLKTPLLQSQKSFLVITLLLHITGNSSCDKRVPLFYINNKYHRTTKAHKHHCCQHVLQSQLSFITHLTSPLQLKNSLPANFQPTAIFGESDMI